MRQAKYFERNLLAWNGPLEEWTMLEIYSHDPAVDGHVIPFASLIAMTNGFVLTEWFGPEDSSR